MIDVTIPALVGIAAIAIYWVVVNSAEFLWNLTQAGNRVTIDQLQEELRDRSANGHAAHGVISEAIGRFLQEGQQLHGRLIDSDETVDDLVKDAKAWLAYVDAWIGENLGAAELGMWRQQSVSAMQYGRAYNDEHNNILIVINKRNKNLISILERYR